MITELSARFLKLENGLNASKIELGDGTIAEVFRTETKLNWLGEDRYVRVRISQGWVAAPDEPAALVGTGLLTPHLLLVDFGRATIEIETQ